MRSSTWAISRGRAGRARRATRAGDAPRTSTFARSEVAVSELREGLGSLPTHWDRQLPYDLCSTRAGHQHIEALPVVLGHHPAPGILRDR